MGLDVSYQLLALIQAGGWLMLPILACSVVAMAIVLERLWALRGARIMPANLVANVWQMDLQHRLTTEQIAELREGSPLGRILAAGLINRRHSREVMKEAIADVGRQVVSGLERYLNTLGTVASIAPLLGLLGTVIGMIDVFSVIMERGVGNPGQLAGGISKALITTAAGLSVAIPTLIFHRYLSGKVNRLAIAMEEQALKMVEVMQGEREEDNK